MFIIAIVLILLGAINIVLRTLVIKETGTVQFRDWFFIIWAIFSMIYGILLIF